MGEELTPTELISGTINEIITKINIVTKEQGKEDKKLKETIVKVIKGSKLDNKKVDVILEWINFKMIDQEKIESVKDLITKLIDITKDTTFEEMTYQEIIDREKTILKQTKLGEELVSEIVEWIDAYEKPENKLHGIIETIQKILKVTKIQTDEKSITVDNVKVIEPTDETQGPTIMGNAPKQIVLDLIGKSEENSEVKETINKWTEKHHEVKNTVETLGNLIPIMVTLIEEAVVDSKEPTTQVKKDIKAKLIHFIKGKTNTCCSKQISKLETWINEHEEELTPTELISGTINEIITKMNIVTKEQGKEDKELKETIVKVIQGSKLDNKKVNGILEWINFKTIDQEK